MTWLSCQRRQNTNKPAGVAGTGSDTREMRRMHQTALAALILGHMWTGTSLKTETHTHILLQRTSKHQGQNLTAVAEYVLECCGGRTEISHGTVRNTHVWVGISLGLRDPKWSIRVIHWSSASRCSGKIDYKYKQICSGTIMDIDEWTSGSSLWNMKVLRTLNLLWFSDIWMDYLQKTDFFSLRVWSQRSS